MFPETNSVKFKLVLFRIRCSATCPFSLTISLIPAMAMTAPFLAENQMTEQMLVFQAQNKCRCFCYGKVCVY
jgi:hypothetical protein